jgi:hypothetical protein
VRLTADQLVIRDHVPDWFTIGDGCGALIHIVLPVRMAQDAELARRQLRELARVCTAAVDAIPGTEETR